MRFGVENPAHYRLMFGDALSAAIGCPPPAVAESAATAKGLLRDVIRQGAESGGFAASPTSAEALDTAVLAAWSLVHGLTTLLIDGLAGGETAAGPFPALAAERIAGHVTQLLLDGVSVREVSQKSEAAS